MRSRRSYLNSLAGGFIGGKIVSNVFSTDKDAITDASTKTHSITVDGDSVKVQTEHFPFKQEQNVSLSLDKYYSEKSQDYTYHTQLLNRNDTEWMNNFVKSFVPEYKYNEVSFIASFVRDIEYKIDSKSTKQLQYSRHPIETLIDGEGDCTDKTILLGRILTQLGYTIGYVIVPQHILLLIPKQEVSVTEPNIIVKTQEHEYMFLEATYSDPIGKSEHISKSDILYTYTKEEGITSYNLTNTPEHILKVLRYIKNS